MNNYEIHFRFNGSFYKELITCQNGFKARDLIKAKGVFI